MRAALAVFVLDGIYVLVVFVLILQRTTVERVFQGIASAVLGQAAFSGGWWSALLGVLLHFSVALGWSVVWIVAYERSDFLQRATSTPIRAVVVGAAYGIFVWLAMHFIVLPLTYSKPGPLLNFGSILVGVAHLLVVGPRHRAADTAPVIDRLYATGGLPFSTRPYIVISNQEVAYDNDYD